MTDRAKGLSLARDIEHYLATLAKLYESEGQRQKLELLVNSKVRVHEGWSYDNLDGGVYGHALFLTVPENLYLTAVREREKIQSQIKVELNKIHNVRHEFIEEVFLDLEVMGDRDWRTESGLVQSRLRSVTAEASRRVWDADGYRVFLSHKVEVKKEVAELKERLRIFGISGFVAHEDIHPTKEWQDEIENALATMDAFVALMTKDFHDSLWTDQEVGFALGRGVPIIAVKLGRDPYGFLGKFQALAGNWETVAEGVVKLLIKQPRMLDAYIGAIERCSGFDGGNLLASILTRVDALSDDQTNRLVSAFNSNTEIRGSFGFNGTRPAFYGAGLASHLSRITGKSYKFLGSGRSRRISL